MKTPRPLPQPLTHGLFTRQQALTLGVTDRRLRAGDIRRHGRGLYSWTGSPEPTPPPPHPVPSDLSFLRQIQAEYPDSWFSHTTAATIFGLELPSWATSSEEVHFSRHLRSTTTARHPLFHSHAVLSEEGEVVTFQGLRVSRPGRIFFDLMNVLPEKELVALGDQLVRRPRFRFEGRREPWETPASLSSIVHEHRKTRGIVRGRAAVAQVRIGADSRMETFLRLSLCEAGLPEPSLQVRPRPGSPFTGDLGYEEERIAIHYDGALHFDPRQQTVDQRRNFAFELDGWRNIFANSEDRRDDFRRVIRHVRLALNTEPNPF